MSKYILVLSFCLLQYVVRMSFCAVQESVGCFCSHATFLLYCVKQHQAFGGAGRSKGSVGERGCEGVEVCLASGAYLLLFILPFLLWAEILALPDCLRQEKGNIKRRRKGGRWQNMTGGRWEEDRTLNCAWLVHVFIAAQWNPPLYWAKTKGPKCHLLGGNIRLISAFKYKHRAHSKTERARQDTRLKLVQKQEEELVEFKDNLWDNVCEWVKCTDTLSPWQHELIVFSLHGSIGFVAVCQVFPQWWTEVLWGLKFTHTQGFHGYWEQSTMLPRRH